MITKEFIILVLIALLIASPIAWYQKNLWLDNFAFRIDLSWTFVAISGLVALIVSVLTVSYQAFIAAKKIPQGP